MIDRNGKKIYNCPNCAAPIGYGPKCEYCGTVLRWEPFDVKKVYVNVRPLAADVFMDNDLLQYEHVRRYVEDRLCEQIARALPAIWELREENDPIRNGKRYRAVIYVGRRET